MSKEAENVSEWDKWIKDFLKMWFDGLMEGIDQLDEEIRLKVLEMTGRACAKAHATVLFEKAWDESKQDLNLFIKKINEKMGAEIYSRKGENELIATYEKCYCPLVSLGLTNSPTLCNCSPNWVKENFETIFKKPVKITTNETVLRGGEKCNFTVSFEL